MIILLIKMLIAGLFLVFGYGVWLIAKEWHRNGKYHTLIYVFKGLILMPFSYAIYFKLCKNYAMQYGKNNDIEIKKYLASYKISIIFGCVAYITIIMTLIIWSIAA